ncbi:hypothetical protein MTR67_012437, partial [Solanum verrucosum]
FVFKEQHTSPSPTRSANGAQGEDCFDNDPSTGSPTKNYLRLLLPLNNKVQWTSRNVVGSKPPTSPQSEHFTNHSIGRSDGRCVQRAWTYN